MGKLCKELREFEKQHAGNYALLDRLRCDILYHLGWGNRCIKPDKLLSLFCDMYCLWDLLPVKPKWLSREQIDILRYLCFGGEEFYNVCIDSMYFSKNGCFVKGSFCSRDEYGKMVFKKLRIDYSDIKDWVSKNELKM